MLYYTKVLWIEREVFNRVGSSALKILVLSQLKEVDYTNFNKAWLAIDVIRSIIKLNDLLPSRLLSFAEL